MTVMILMAGGSQAFEAAGYPYPKWLVEIDGAPMVQHVLENLGELRHPPNRVICLVLEAEARRFHIDDVVRLLVGHAIVIMVPRPSAGAACTSLLAIEEIDPVEPLLILNGDQILELDLAQITSGFLDAGLDGGLPVFRDVHPRWSFVKCDSGGMVIEAAEKRPISDLATAGAYFFRRGGDYVEACFEMIRKDASIDGVFFVCPAYNEMILKDARIGVRHIAKSSYWSLASPQGVREYEGHLRGKKGMGGTAGS